jgi:15-cis-phytoene synthase/lycopene beta-cyclase
MVPFEWRSKKTVKVTDGNSLGTGKKEDKLQEEMVQTLPRRPQAGLFWLLMTVVGGTGLFLPIWQTPSSTPFDLKLISSTWPTIQETPLFYLCSILIWISPVLAILTTLGASVSLKEDWIAWTIGTGYLWLVDTIAIRAGAWAIDGGIGGKLTLGWEVWKGLPVE